MICSDQQLFWSTNDWFELWFIIYGNSTVAIDLYHNIDFRTKVWDKHKHKTRQQKEQNKIRKWTNCHSHPQVLRSAAIWKISVFIRFCIANGQALPVQFVFHTDLQKLQFSNWWCFAILWCMTLTTGPLISFGLLFHLQVNERMNNYDFWKNVASISISA